MLNIMMTLCQEKKPEAVDVYVFTFDENPFSVLPFLRPAAMKGLAEEDFEDKEKAYAQWVA